MPKKAVVEYECERCGRKWYAEMDGTTPPATPSVAVRFTTQAGEVTERQYDVLCSSCEGTVRAYVEHISKALTNHSPQRKARKKEEVGPDDSEPVEIDIPVSMPPPSLSGVAGKPAGGRAGS